MERWWKFNVFIFTHRSFKMGESYITTYLFSFKFFLIKNQYDMLLLTHSLAGKVTLLGRELWEM